MSASRQQQVKSGLPFAGFFASTEYGAIGDNLTRKRSGLGMFPLILTVFNREYSGGLESLLMTVSIRGNIKRGV